MKKLIATLAACAAAALLSAQDVTFGIGARGTFGFGLGSMLTGDVWDSASMDGMFSVIPGVILGIGFGYEFDSHNMLMGDLRFLTDFTQIKGEYKAGDSTEEVSVLTRRGLSLGVSYIYTF